MKSGNKWPFFAEVGSCQSSCIPNMGIPFLNCVQKIEQGKCSLSAVKHLCGGIVLNDHWVLTGNLDSYP